MDIVEREWKFSLESAFTTVYGNDMGKSNKTCVQTRSNSIRCEDQHIRESEWQMTTTFDFYHLGIIRTHELPYKKNLVVKKFYEKLFNPEDVENEPYTEYVSLLIRLRIQISIKYFNLSVLETRKMMNSGTHGMIIGDEMEGHHKFRTY